MTEAERFNAWADATYPNRTRHDTGRMYAAWNAALAPAPAKPAPKAKKTRAKSGKFGSVEGTD